MKIKYEFFGTSLTNFSGKIAKQALLVENVLEL